MYKYEGLMVDPANGVIYGRRGGTVGARHDRGYIVVGSQNRTMFAHRLIWEAVNGPIPDEMQINHLNGVKTDNRIANLELVSCGDNHRHAFRTGLRKVVVPHKLSAADVLAVRRGRELGLTSPELAEKYHVHRATIDRVVRGATYRTDA
ncbi:MAG: HNH endonuclease [Ilumatobacteraceae bacterium]